jgi:6,7-dimethyl-8-ribityllumazine synthase
MKADDQSEPLAIEGEIDGLSGALPDGHVYIIASRYHRAACDSMTQAAIESLQAAGFDADSIHVARVPGAWELPLAVQVALDLPETIGVIAIGVVIRGETSHDEHINRAVSLELMRLGSEYSRPVGLALLTCNNQQQVDARTGGELGNKGTEAAQAVVEMLRLIEKIERE